MAPKPSRMSVKATPFSDEVAFGLAPLFGTRRTCHPLAISSPAVVSSTMFSRADCAVPIAPAVIVIVLLTFVQPALWLRGGMDLALLAGVVLAQWASLKKKGAEAEAAAPVS